MSVRNNFRKVFNTKTPVLRGTITKVSGSSIYVTSPNGLREFQVSSTGIYKSGDTVRFQGNALLGVIPAGIEGTIHVV